MGLYNFSVAGGEQKTLDLTWQSTDDNGVSTPYDLTGCSAVMEFRRQPGGTLIARVTSTDDIEIQPDDTTGLIRVVLDSEVTTDLAGSGVEYASGYRYLMHDVYVEFPDGDIRQVVHGRVEVLPPITDVTMIPAPGVI